MKNTLNHKHARHRARRLFALLTCLMLALAVTAAPALAATATPTVTGDALQAVSKLSDFIFSLIRAVGLILLGYGILQVGLSFQSHDPSQRSNGILTIAGGIIIVFTKELLNLITNAG
ncbi:MAG: formate hydrogenlyase [Oscillospiraceae bacterium]|nr:formate hydrogenlyase [Oscillospiraceae bacterium]